MLVGGAKWGRWGKVGGLLLFALRATLGLPAKADFIFAGSVEAYYQEASGRPSHELPTEDTYRRLIQLLKDEGWEEPDITGVVEELNLLKTSLGLKWGGCDHNSIDYPALVVKRLEGDVDPGIIWLAACHGLLRKDRFAAYFAPGEYTRWHVCPPSYQGPPVHPSLNDAH